MAMSTSSAIPMPTVGAIIRMNSATVSAGRSSSRCMCKVKAVATSSARAGSSRSRTSGARKDYYEVLSLERSAAVGAEEVKRAYRRLALRYHPDLCPPSRRAESTELFLELRRAYETLSDPARKVRYDAELRTMAAGGAGEAASSADVLFVRSLWEAQLSGLRARSERRQQRTRNGGLRRSD